MEGIKIKRLWRAEQGQTLVEVLIAMALAAILLPALATSLVTAREGRGQDANRLQAAALMQEGQEAVRSVRERSWAQFAVNGTYYLTTASNAWSLSTNSAFGTIGIYTRSVVISDVQRDAAGVVVAAGGTVDSSTKRVVVTVGWSQPMASSISSTAYFTRYAGNAVWTQTTDADFSAGTETNVTVGGNNVQLATTTVLNWGAPSLVGSYNTSGTQDALDIFTAGNYAYLCDGTVVNIFDITNPTTPVFTDSYTAGGTVNHVYVDGNYAYLSTTSTSAEVVVVNITNPANVTLAANVNLTGTAAARSAFVVGGFAYIARASSTTLGSREFQILNVSNPASPTALGGIDYSAQVNNIKVSGNFAYLATSIASQEFIVVNVTDKNTPTTAGSNNAAGTAIANDLGVDSDGYVYLGRANNTSGAEVHVYNVSNPASPSIVGNYERGSNVTGVSIVNDYAFLSTTTTNQELTILNVATPSSPSLLGSFDANNTVNDVKGGGNYAYLATASNTQELMVVGPAITTPYVLNGTLESSSFDRGVGNTAAYNYFTFTSTEPANTDVQFQFASNDNNTTWNYAGPDGTASTFYTAAGAIRYSTTGRYFRYRATLSTTVSTSTPTLSDITVNYSP